LITNYSATYDDPIRGFPHAWGFPDLLYLLNAILKDVSKRKQVVEKAVSEYGLSQRRACRALKVCRNSVRDIPEKRVDEDAVTVRIIELASNYSRYG